MACRTIPIAGGFAILCGRGQRVAACSVPGCSRPHAKLCDFALAEKLGTCDAKLCATCAVHVGPDRDYCPPHAKAEASRG